MVAEEAETMVAGEAMLAGEEAAEEAETMVLEGGVIMPFAVGVISAEEAEDISDAAGADGAGAGAVAEPISAEVISADAAGAEAEADGIICEPAEAAETGAWICPSPIWLTIALAGAEDVLELAGTAAEGEGVSMVVEEVISAEEAGVSMAAEEVISAEEGIGAGISEEGITMTMISDEDI